MPAALSLAAEDPFGTPKDDGGLRPDGIPWPTVVDVDGNTWTRRPPSRLSPSAFNDWRSCQRGFAFDRIQRRPSEPGLPAAIGVHVHRVLDLVMELPAQERTLERALGIHEGLNTKLWDACRRLQAGEPVDDVVGDRDNRDEDIRHAVEVVVLRPGLRGWNDAVERGVRGYFAMASPDKVEVIATEQKFEQKWEMRDSGLVVPITGSADRLDRLPAQHGGGIRIVDYKGLALDTPLPTPSGWTTMAEVQQGDLLLGADGHVTRVLGKSGVHRRPCYRITFDDASSIVCDNQHLWHVRCGRHAGDKVLNADELYALWHGPCASDEPSVRSQARPVVIPNAAEIKGAEAALPIDPYVLGVWLGDGRTRNGHVCGDPADMTEIVEHLKARGERPEPLAEPTQAADWWSLPKPDPSKCIWGHSGYVRWTRGGRPVTRCRDCVRGQQGIAGDLPPNGHLSRRLRAVGLINNKHVPSVYLRASVPQRLELMRGLMDTDGHWNQTRGRAVFVTTLPALRRAMEDLVAGLGWRYYTFTKRYESKRGKRTAFYVHFRPVGHNPFHLARKAEGFAAFTGSPAMAVRRAIKAIDRVNSVPTQCVMVDAPDSLYLAGRQMVPTHNSGKVIPPKFDKGEHDDQILTYAAMVEEDTGELPAAGLLLYVSHRKPKHVEVTPEKVSDVKDRIGQAWTDIHDKFEDDAYEPNPGPLCGWCPHIRECGPGEDEVRRRAANGTGRGGLRADAPARSLLPGLISA